MWIYSRNRCLWWSWDVKGFTGRIHLKFQDFKTDLLIPLSVQPPAQIIKSVLYQWHTTLRHYFSAWSHFQKHQLWIGCSTTFESDLGLIWKNLICAIRTVIKKKIRYELYISKKSDFMHFCQQCEHSLIYLTYIIFQPFLPVKMDSENPPPQNTLKFVSVMLHNGES